MMTSPIFLALANMTISVAQANEPTQTWAPLESLQGEDELAVRSGVGDDGLRRDRTMLMEANLRARYLSVPDSIMDIWFYEESNDYQRPRIRAYAVGVEYVLKPRPINWIMYYEYVGTTLEEGYWDDVEEPANHHDGDWVKPDGLGIHVLGASYGHEVPISDEVKPVWLSMLFGGGFGIGIVTGELNEWNPGSNSDSGCLKTDPAYTRKDDCESDGSKDIPKVLPVVDMTISTKINFADQASIRFDAGLHNVLSVGIAVGGVF